MLVYLPESPPLGLKHTYHPTPLPPLPLLVAAEEVASSSVNPFDPEDMWHVALARGICTQGQRCGICGKEDGRLGGIRLQSVLADGLGG